MRGAGGQGLGFGVRARAAHTHPRAGGTHAGAGKKAFGSNDTPNNENWKQCAAMRGHQNNVVDLSWSPDGSLVASASLDNLVIIWEASSGHRLHTLKVCERWAGSSGLKRKLGGGQGMGGGCGGWSGAGSSHLTLTPPLCPPAAALLAFA